MNITLDDIVRNYRISQGKNTTHFYLRDLKFAVDFCRGFSQDWPFAIKTVQLKMDEKRSVSFPDDLLRINKIGIALQDRVLVFQHDSTISLYHSTEEDNPSQTVNPSYNGTVPIPGKVAILTNFTYNGEVGFISGIDRGHNGIGYYTINNETKEIQMSTDVPSDSNIYLEYCGSGLNLRAKTTIPEQVALLCEKYLHWQNGVMKFGEASAEAQARKLAYDQEQQRVISRTYPVSYEDIVGGLSRSVDQNRFAR